MYAASTPDMIGLLGKQIFDESGGQVALLISNIKGYKRTGEIRG